MQKNASSNSCILRKKGPFKVVVIIVTLWSFLFSIFSYDITWATTRPLESTGVDSKAGGPGNSKELNVETFTLPESLGEVKDQTKAEQAKGASPQKVVIHIHDAHCNYYAQHKINDIIDYLNRTYGVTQVNLEGGKGNYDLSLFTKISDKGVRQKAADYFVKTGRVNGAEYFAINNTGKVNLWGIEDTDLYLENLTLYRNSLKHKSKIDKSLASLSRILSSLKLHIYSKELLQLDKRYGQYKADNLDFKTYLSYLLKKAKENKIDIESFSNVKLLRNFSIQEEKINFKKANTERARLIDEFHSMLSRKSLEELTVKAIEYKTDKLSQHAFQTYLLNKANEININLKRFPEFQKSAAYISSYKNTDKFKLTEEMESLENKIREILYRNDGEKELSILSKNFTMMKRMLSLDLTKKDYEYYKTNKRSFNIKNFTSFIRKYAPRYKIITKLDEDVEDLDHHLENMAKCYECTFKRDDAFLRNLKFTLPLENTMRQRAPKSQQVAILVTGGFHAGNLQELFKKNNISYISILPNFKVEDGYESPYFDLLSRRKTNPVEKHIETILSFTMAIASPFTAIADIVSEKIDNVNVEKEHITLQLELEWAEAKQKGKGLIIRRGDQFLGAIDANKNLITKEMRDKDEEKSEERFEVVEARQFVSLPQLPKPSPPSTTWKRQITRIFLPIILTVSLVFGIITGTQLYNFNKMYKPYAQYIEQSAEKNFIPPIAGEYGRVMDEYVKKEIEEYCKKTGKPVSEVRDGALLARNTPPEFRLEFAIEIIKNEYSQAFDEIDGKVSIEISDITGSKLLDNLLQREHVGLDAICYRNGDDILIKIDRKYVEAQFDPIKIIRLIVHELKHGKQYLGYPNFIYRNVSYLLFLRNELEAYKEELKYLDAQNIPYDERFEKWAINDAVLRYIDTWKLLLLRQYAAALLVLNTIAYFVNKYLIGKIKKVLLKTRTILKKLRVNENSGRGYTGWKAKNRKGMAALPFGESFEDKNSRFVEIPPGPQHGTQEYFNTSLNIDHFDPPEAFWNLTIGEARLILFCLAAKYPKLHGKTTLRLLRPGEELRLTYTEFENFLIEVNRFYEDTASRFTEIRIKNMFSKMWDAYVKNLETKTTQREQRQIKEYRLKQLNAWYRTSLEKLRSKILLHRNSIISHEVTPGETSEAFDPLFIEEVYVHDSGILLKPRSFKAAYDISYTNFYVCYSEGNIQTDNVFASIPFNNCKIERKTKTGNIIFSRTYWGDEGQGGWIGLTITNNTDSSVVIAEEVKEFDEPQSDLLNPRDAFNSFELLIALSILSLSLLDIIFYPGISTFLQGINWSSYITIMLTAGVVGMVKIKKEKEAEKSTEKKRSTPPYSMTVLRRRLEELLERSDHELSRYKIPILMALHISNMIGIEEHIKSEKALRSFAPTQRKLIEILPITKAAAKAYMSKAISILLNPDREIPIIISELKNPEKLKEDKTLLERTKTEEAARRAIEATLEVRRMGPRRKRTGREIRDKKDMAIQLAVEVNEFQKKWTKDEKITLKERGERERTYNELNERVFELHSSMEDMGQEGILGINVYIAGLETLETRLKGIFNTHILPKLMEEGQIRNEEKQKKAERKKAKRKKDSTEGKNSGLLGFMPFGRSGTRSIGPVGLFSRFFRMIMPVMQMVDPGKVSIYETGKGIVNIDGKEVDVREYVKTKQLPYNQIDSSYAKRCFRLLTDVIDEYSANQTRSKDYYFTVTHPDSGLHRVNPNRDLNEKMTYAFQLEQNITMLIAPIKYADGNYVEIFIHNEKIIGYGLSADNAQGNIVVSLNIFPPYRENKVPINRKQLYIDRLCALYEFFRRPRYFWLHVSQLGFVGRASASSAPIFYLQLGFIPLAPGTLSLVNSLSNQSKLNVDQLVEIVHSLHEVGLSKAFMVLDIESSQSDFATPEKALFENITVVEKESMMDAEGDDMAEVGGLHFRMAGDIIDAIRDSGCHISITHVTSKKKKIWTNENKNLTSARLVSYLDVKQGDEVDVEVKGPNALIVGQKIVDILNRGADSTGKPTDGHGFMPFGRSGTRGIGPVGLFSRFLQIVMPVMHMVNPGEMPSGKVKSAATTVLKLISIPLVAITLSFIYADQYISFIAASFWNALAAYTLVGAVSRGAGMYMNQTIRGDKINWNYISRWVLAGGTYVGIVVFGLWYSILNTYVDSTFFKVFYDITLFAAFVGLPTNFLIHKYIVYGGKKDILLIDSIKDFVHLFALNAIWWGTGLSIGWYFYPQYIVPIAANMGIVWSGIMIYLFDSWFKKPRDGSDVAPTPVPAPNLHLSPSVEPILQGAVVRERVKNMTPGERGEYRKDQEDIKRIFGSGVRYMDGKPKDQQPAEPPALTPSGDKPKLQPGTGASVGSGGSPKTPSEEDKQQVSIITFDNLVKEGANAEELIKKLADIGLRAFGHNEPAKSKKRDEHEDNIRWQAGKSAVLIAKEGEDIVGTVILNRLGDAEAGLIDLSVSPEWQSHNIGTKLMDEALAWSVENGIKHLVVTATTVEQNNVKSAMEFYEKYFGRKGITIEPVEGVKHYDIMKSFTVRLSEVPDKKPPETPVAAGDRPKLQPGTGVSSAREPSRDWKTAALKSSIEVATLEDIDSIVDIAMNEMLGNEYHAYEAYWIVRRKTVEEGLRQTIKGENGPHSVVLVARLDKEIIGYVKVTCLPGNKTGTISTLVVREQYHHRGVGTQLFGEAIRKLKELSNIMMIEIYDSSDYKQTEKIAKRYGFKKRERNFYVLELKPHQSVFDLSANQQASRHEEPKAKPDKSEKPSNDSDVIPTSVPVKQKTAIEKYSEAVREALGKIDRKGDIVKVIVGRKVVRKNVRTPEEQREQRDFEKAVKEMNEDLAKAGFGIIEESPYNKIMDKNQIVLFEIVVDEKDTEGAARETEKNYWNAVKKAYKDIDILITKLENVKKEKENVFRNEKIGRLKEKIKNIQVVSFAPQMESVPGLANPSNAKYEKYRKRANVTPILDSYSDGAYPLIGARAALGRLVAEHLNTNKRTLFNDMKTLIGKIAENNLEGIESFKELMDYLNKIPLMIISIVEDILNWMRCHKAAVTSL